MKPKTLILIVAAVGCGLAASYLTSRLLAERNKEQPAPVEKVAVLIAKQKVGMGTLIKNPDQFFMIKEFTKGQEPKKALRSLDEVKDKRLNKPLSGEQFVTSDDLIDGKNGELAVLLPAGKRAVALRVNMETSSGGWVLPNSRVDLIVTVRKGDDGSWSRIVMQNMLVVAVDLIRDRDPEKNSIIPSVVTLAATPEEAEKLAMAQTMGEIRLILRPFGEEDAVSTRGAKPGDVARSNSANSSGVQEQGGGDPRLPGGVSQIPDFPSGKPSQLVKPPEPKDDAPPPPRIHTLIIHNGLTTTKAHFVLGPDGGAISRDVDKQEVPSRPEKNAPGHEPAEDDKNPAATEPAKIEDQ